ncbi:histone-lysine N-methyltransferase SETMAR-like [Octopus sinensis]|uniref:Histone-lysine N-methyltransferase SETMAR-like n=1 Tax=Octopus sinensis TaxID=2607531 RepID=A0A6P7TV14_9MOLL|nr:histone-lysine N-methyltransferase SETMAR-like [Octopus sinensis]
MPCQQTLTHVWTIDKRIVLYYKNVADVSNFLKFRICIVFKVVPELTARNTNELFGEDLANERTVRRWFEKFWSCEFPLENQLHGRRETKVDNDELETVVEADISQTTRALTARFDVSIPVVLDHFKQIGKVKKLDEWVPYELNELQITRRLETCSSLLSQHKSEPFLRCMLRMMQMDSFQK